MYMIVLNTELFQAYNESTVATFHITIGIEWTDKNNRQMTADMAHYLF